MMVFLYEMCMMEEKIFDKEQYQYAIQVSNLYA